MQRSLISSGAHIVNTAARLWISDEDAGCKCVIAISETGNRWILYHNPLWFGVGRWEGCDNQGQR